MSIQINSAEDNNVRITFTLSHDSEDQSVSVVGSFNDWEVGHDEMRPNGTGRLTVTIDVPAGRDVFFRYLGENGHWFDDPDAERAGDGNCVIRMGVPPSTEQQDAAGRDTNDTVVDLTEPQTSDVSATKQR